MLEFIRELYASFRQTSLERVKSPFLGAFVFSWLAFNWPMLAILFFSKKDIELRLDLINEKYDLGSYLLGPIFTTALLLLLLPQINKIITKIQDKPNSETIELTLSSKIKVAELQQSIAEIEAKKKLADKREEKFIEDSIYAIKEENAKLNEQSIINAVEINELNKKLSESKIEENNYKALMNAANESRDKAEKAISKFSDANTSLNTTIRDLQNHIKNNENSIKDSITQINHLDKEKNNLADVISSLNEQILVLKETFPAIFKNQPRDGTPQIALTDRAKKALPEVNKTLIRESLTEALNGKRDNQGSNTPQNRKV